MHDGVHGLQHAVDSTCLLVGKQGPRLTRSLPAAGHHVCAHRFASGPALYNSDALIQEFYTKEAPNSVRACMHRQMHGCCYGTGTGGTVRLGVQLRLGES